MKEFSALLRLRMIICCRKIGLAILLLFTLSAGVFVVQGQTSFGRISGTVSDSTGAVIANATVIVSNPATNFSRTVMTDENGYYTVTNLPVGTYSISVEVANFK